MWEYNIGHRVTVRPPSSPAAAVLPVAVIPIIPPPPNCWPLQVWFFNVSAGYICHAGVDTKLVFVSMERTIRHLTDPCLFLITIIFTAATLLTKSGAKHSIPPGKGSKRGVKTHGASLWVRYAYPLLKSQATRQLIGQCGFKVYQ